MKLNNLLRLLLDFFVGFNKARKGTDLENSIKENKSPMKSCVIYNTKEYYKIGVQVTTTPPSALWLIEPPIIFISKNLPPEEFAEVVLKALNKSRCLSKSEWTDLLRDEQGNEPRSGRETFSAYSRKTAIAFDEKSMNALDRKRNCGIKLKSNGNDNEELIIVPDETYKKQDASFNIHIQDPFSNKAEVGRQILETLEKPAAKSKI